MIKSIGIIGAGQMGNGIAHVCALSGYDVTMLDANADALPKALATIAGNLDRQVSRGKVKAEDKRARSSASGPAPITRASRIATSSSRRQPRTRRSSARCSRSSVRS
jgi:3-hydroxyacyl-CoA dehydrogenase